MMVSKRSSVGTIRLPQIYPSDAECLSPEDRRLVHETAFETAEHLTQNYLPGFGVFPTADPTDNFYKQLYARDFSHAGTNYFVYTNPRAVTDSLNTIFKYQKPDGMLPFKVEREYGLLKVIPGFRHADKYIFNFVESKLRKREERPVYEGEDFAAADDTVPCIIMVAGEFMNACAEGREFVARNFDHLKQAAAFFQTKTDPEDCLAITTRDNSDWTDSLRRRGKLGTLNVCWGRALRVMQYISRQLGYDRDAQRFRDEFRIVKQSVTSKLYHQSGGYFRAKEGEDRLDTVASICGALYLLNPTDARRVEEALKLRVEHNSGLQNFDPPYRMTDAFWVHRFFGLTAYHNRFVWPWVICQNIQVKIKIALQHKEPVIRNQYRRESVEDLLRIAKLFRSLSGAYEIVDPERPQPGKMRFYTPPKNFMGSLAGYQGAYRQLNKLSWI